MMIKRGMVFGVGVNNANYKVSWEVNGRQYLCKFYSTWLKMLERCYSEAYQKRKPTYKGCYVCSEWLVFTNFKSWMEKQDWEGKCLDKDVLGDGKCYSPLTCAFILPITNTFFNDRFGKSEFMPGVAYKKNSGRFTAQCRNPITKKREWLGSFLDEQSAHNAWVDRKHSICIQLSEIESDPRVKLELLNKYVRKKDDE